MTTNNKIANRKTIAHQFQTDELTTHRILMNLNFGFFISHFGDDAKAMWKEAHPFLYPSGLQDYTSFSLNFIEKYFTLFSQNQFYTSAKWEFNKKTNKAEWTYKSGYRIV